VGSARVVVVFWQLTVLVPAGAPHAHIGPRGEHLAAVELGVELIEARCVHEQLLSDRNASACARDLTLVPARVADIVTGRRGDDAFKCGRIEERAQIDRV
jgi:hypothetical protein